VWREILECSPYQEALGLLQMNCCVLYGENHNPMLVKRIIQYLNEGLQIMTNKHDSNCIALEAILLLIYGMDILRSMAALGHKFSFTIDFSMGKHAELYSTPGTVESYSKQLVTCFSCCWAITKLLVKKQGKTVR
jgi:hypothetical protein